VSVIETARGEFILSGQSKLKLRGRILQYELLPLPLPFSPCPRLLYFLYLLYSPAALLSRPAVV